MSTSPTGFPGLFSNSTTNLPIIIHAQREKIKTLENIIHKNKTFLDELLAKKTRASDSQQNAKGYKRILENAVIQTEIILSAVKASKEDPERQAALITENDFLIQDYKAQKSEMDYLLKECATELNRLCPQISSIEKDIREQTENLKSLKLNLEKVEQQLKQKKEAFNKNLLASTKQAVIRYPKAI